MCKLVPYILKLQNVKIELAVVQQTVYKAPGQANGKIIEATSAAAWQDGAQALSNNNGHSFAKTLEHVVGNDNNVKFLAYNNAPPGVPSIKTKSNSKGVIILATNADSAAWIVHTVPGFPTAKTAYSWPVAENARGHLLICLTISETQINAIAASLLLVQPIIHYNDIPKTETAALPYFNKLAEGKIPTLPPFTSRLTIRTQDGASPVTVHIYSKSESSKYEIYKKVIVRVLKKTIKVWSKRDNRLKGDCRGSQRHIRLIKIYKAPGQANGKIIEATAAAAWQNGAQPLSNNAQHSFATALQHVVADNNNVKFLAYNNAPPGVPSIKTKSNSKGVIILATNADSAAWIVHTVPGFPAAKTGYSWPVAENARGHLLICLTISESQINAIAASLLLVQPIIHYNDIPKTETAALPYFNKLAEGKIPTLPPFTSRLTIRTQSVATPVTVHIYSKSESSKYEIYKKVIVRVLKKTIKVWSKRDKILKGDCRGLQRHIRLIKSPAVVVDHNTNLEADITNWAVSDPGNIFCHIDKPYLATAAGAWQNGAQALSSDNGHSFAKTLEHVVGNNNNVKFLAYNNAPPGVPSIKTKSNSKGIIILSTNADSAAWIVHTVPGFPTAKTAYSWPVAENARGHLLICLTISETQINAIAASLLLVQPMVHYNDIPEAETAGMPYFNKLAEGKIPTLPPFTSRRSIRTENAAGPVAVHIYSKSESSKYEVYKKVIVRVLKKTIKVWSKRDNILKGDCRGSQRHIRLIKSPAVIRDHNTNLEADITNWAVSDPGNIFCHIDKPYFKNQTREPAMAVCIENNDIFARFNEIAAQLENCPQ
ncbi:Deoxyribonuclease-2-alpha [Trichinella pseudospiralis]|uniref:Deoxyribonuclease-2-alpha n=1 Tax=Trichinella pseudospiralis TaxID=6337 RepID=A0A0V1KB81_TRIPS|nr:Deoxyribonuclease-2-alpha [Trichinella pseudospiralis]